MQTQNAHSSGHVLGLSFSGFICTATVIVLSVQLVAEDDLNVRASWSIPTSGQAETRMREWLDTRNINEDLRSKADAIWKSTDSNTVTSDLLSRVANTAALVDPRVAKLTALCQRPKQSLLLPEMPVLSAPEHPVFLKATLRLYYARWLAQHGWHDEVLLQLADTSTDDVLDPASLLFYRATAEHTLLKRDACLKSLSKLLEKEKENPHRYATVARLLEADSQQIKADSLDEVARLMNDVRRRLDLGRTGKRVREQEDEVIAKLDKMIEKLEEQQQQQQQQQPGQPQGNQNAPQTPANESNALPGSGPGDVDPRNLGDDIDWGSLPPKERQATLQRISEGLPAHFREVIEAYFKKIASKDD
ncbi:MAG: hypothetical protein VX346_19945 [Planctomycetota bacterium]|nr:hypothetical protein [Planctomycetota bacterium]